MLRAEPLPSPGHGLSPSSTSPALEGNFRLYYQNDFFGSDTRHMQYRLQFPCAQHHGVLGGFTHEVFEVPGAWPEPVDHEDPGSVTFARKPRGIRTPSSCTWGASRSLAIKLSKISSDLVLRSPGPRAGLAEINLPAAQPGASIMPGKVHPAIPELVNLVSYRVIGDDVAVGLGARNGQMQLNAYEPLEAIAALESQTLLTNTLKTFREKKILSKEQIKDVLDPTKLTGLVATSHEERPRSRSTSTGISSGRVWRSSSGLARSGPAILVSRSDAEPPRPPHKKS